MGVSPYIRLGDIGEKLLCGPLAEEKKKMEKKVFTCQEIDLSHEQMVTLRETGHLNLGIDNSLALQISNARGLGPAKTTASVAFHFWNWVAFGVFGFSIYWSFVNAWWWFIPGILAFGVVIRANKKGNISNLLDAAMIDQDFYERVREVGGWTYQIEEDVAGKYRKQKKNL